MIILDASILLHAYDSGSDLHVQARSWVQQGILRRRAARVALADIALADRDGGSLLWL